MKNNFFMLIIVFGFLHFSIYPQFKYGEVIHPGKGIGKILLGMTYKKVTEILGNKYTEENYDNLKTSYDDDLMVRVILKEPYNRILDYQNTVPKDEHFPIYRLYFLGDKLSFISLTSWGKDEKLIKEYGVKNKIFLNGSTEKIKKFFGDDYILENEDWMYLEQGISFVVTAEEIKAIHIFPSLKCEEVNEYLKKYFNDKQKELNK
jgi:hypothetical protein